MDGEKESGSADQDVKKSNRTDRRRDRSGASAVSGAERSVMSLFKKKPRALKTTVLRFLREDPKQDDSPVRVQLGVGGHESIKEEIKISLKEGLESLGDVIVTATNPRHRIFVNGVDSSPPIFAVVFTETLDLNGGASYSSVLRSVLSGNLGDEAMDCVDRITSNHDLLCNLLVLTGPSMEVAGLCDEVVKRFDQQVLEPIRQHRGNDLRKSRRISTRGT